MWMFRNKTQIKFQCEIKVQKNKYTNIKQKQLSIIKCNQSIKPKSSF